MSTEIISALRSLAGSTRHFRSGARVFRRGSRVNNLFVLESGELKLSRMLSQGSELILHRAIGSCVVAEASVYSSTYHCDAICLNDCTLRNVARTDFLQLLQTDSDLSAKWSAYLAHGLQTSRFRTEILRMKKVCDRVDAWLTFTGNDLPPKGQWKEMAAELGVSAEALYREFATRRPIE